MRESLMSSKQIVMNPKNEKQPTRLVIFIQDVMKMHSCSASTASRRIKEVKDHLSKLDHQLVTIKEYCEYFAFPYLETCEFLKLM